MICQIVSYEKVAIDTIERLKKHNFEIKNLSYEKQIGICRYKVAITIARVTIVR